jgi:hypothetical protein
LGKEKARRITREQAIKALKWFKEYNEEDYCGGDRIQDEYGDWYYRITEQDFEAFDVAIKALEQEPRWIPTSERLPEEDGEYYATIYDTDENYQYMDIAELEDGIWQYKDYVKVLAWMPLPKPYEPQESEET